jgi:drug/metabolite transporter (DMT)-like permease
MEGWIGIIAATCFALGSTLYSYLFLRARSIPVPLAWLGVLASILLVVVLPLQLAGFIQGPVTNFVWLPILVFEVMLALWLLIKGVATQPNRQSLPAHA